MQTELTFKNYFQKHKLSTDIQTRYPQELTNLAKKGFDFYQFDNLSNDVEIIELLDNLIINGGTSVVYDVGINGEKVPNLRNPKNYDSAEMVIRVIKQYLLMINKADGFPDQVNTISAKNPIIQDKLLFLEILKKTYKSIFEEFYEFKSNTLSSNYNDFKPLNSQIDKLYWEFFKRPYTTINSPNLPNNPKPISNNIGENKIYYGVPGCGKSYQLKLEIEDNYLPTQYDRTVFHQDYNYSDFVGQLVPIQDGDNLRYAFQPGIFTLSLLKAYNDPSKPFFLIIEEINRGNAPAIFGDLFQLLDRDETGTSMYGISHKHIQNILNKPDELVRIPSNLSIIGTMNTSDQNVFTMDTAFKRRWNFTLISNDITKFTNSSSLYVPKSSISWKEFHEKINKKIVANQMSFGNFDDKQIGPFFIDSNALSKNQFDQDPIKSNRFAYKVLEYLWNDVAKISKQNWFHEKIQTLEQLIFEFKDNGFSGLLSNLFE